jgi:hypothetical protein
MTSYNHASKAAKMAIIVLFSIVLSFRIHGQANCNCPSTANCPPLPGQAIVNITDFGADPLNPASYHQALRCAATFIQNRGGYTTLNINAPDNAASSYLVGNETGSSTNNTPYWRSEKIFELSNCQSVTIQGVKNTGTGKYPVIKLKDGQHMGLFNPATGAAPPTLNYWNIYDVSNPQACANMNWNPNINTCAGWAEQHYMTAPSSIFTFTNCAGVILKNIEIDGNSANMIFGGYWGIGPKPYELGNHGIALYQCKNVLVENMNVHHAGGDGITIVNNVTSSSYPSDNITVKNSSFMHSGRNGITWTGGDGLTVSDCKSNSNATSSDAIQTSPAAGIDIEPEVFRVSGNDVPNSCKNGVFERCDFIGNQGNAIAITQRTGDYSGNQQFRHCNIGATSNTSGTSINYIEQRNCNFEYCNFYGRTAALLNAVNDAEGIKFYRCLFTDCYNGSYVPNQQFYTTYFDGARARAEECTFTTYNPAKQWNVYFTANNPPSTDDYHKIINCSFTKYNASVANNVGGLVYNCNLPAGTSSIFRIHRDPGAAPNWNMFYAFDYSIPVPGPGNDQYNIDYNYMPPSCELNCSSNPFVIRDIKSFGAIGNGIADDHAAFEAAETFFNTRGGRGTLYLSPGTYKVGKQVWNSGTNSFVPDNVLGLAGVSCLSIIGDNAKVVFNAALKTGKYDAGGNQCSSCGVSGAGAFIRLDNSEDITIKSAAQDKYFEIDGNINNFSGTYGINDAVLHYGILLGDSKKVKLDRLNIHHFAQDGMTIWNTTPGGINTTAQNISVSNCIFKSNLMSGLAAYGVAGLSVDNSIFQQNSKNTGTVSPLAGHGIRLQTIGNNIIKDVTLSNVDISDNRAAGLYVYGQGSIYNLNVTNSVLYGSTNPAIYMTDEEAVFRCCKIFGLASFAGSSNNAVESRHKEFLNCEIGDCYNGAPVYDHNYTYYGMLQFGYGDNPHSDLLIKDCNFKTYTHSPLILYGNSGSCNSTVLSRPVVLNCTFDINYANGQVNSGVGVILHNTSISNTTCSKTSYVNNYFTEGCGGPAPVTTVKSTPDQCLPSTPNPQLQCPFRLIKDILQPSGSAQYVKNK